MDLVKTGKLLLRANKAILTEVYERAEPMFLKLQRMQEIYLNKNSALYSNSQIDNIKRHLESVKLKFVLTDIHLEQLWALSMVARSNLRQAVDKSIDKLEWTDTQSAVGYVFLESFLFQARSFIDIFFGYICLLMGKKKIDTMNQKKFTSFMRSNGEPFKNKSIQLLNYFKKEIFGEDTWGTTLRDNLRGIIAHKERLRSSREGSEKLLGKVLLDWPTIRGKTFDRLCQDIKEDIFGMIQKTSSILFDLEWKSGPYRDDLWNK